MAEGMTSRTDQAAGRRAKNGELRNGIAKAKGKAKSQQRDTFLEEKIARLDPFDF